ncbi:hypothetical protein C8F01DRAFT_1281834 [Mycena amicta]|nr:hypothetical protein C8F01DRAFT_1281834 [Mycena amicta]
MLAKGYSSASRYRLLRDDSGSLKIAVSLRLLSLQSGLHFSLESRATNTDGSLPIYKNPQAAIEARVADLLPRMTVQEKVSQIIQGDIKFYLANPFDPLDDTLEFNQTGLAEMNDQMGGSVWAGYQMPWDKLVFAVNVAQKYHQFPPRVCLKSKKKFQAYTASLTTARPSPPQSASPRPSTPISFNKSHKSSGAKQKDSASTTSLRPVLDLSRELRWGRVEENYGEDPFLTGEIGNALGRRRNASSTAIARVAATCKHFAAFGSPQGGLNIAQVSGGERELRTNFLKPFNRACLNALSLMTAYSSYDGIPAAANKRKYMLTDILRNEWGYKYWVTCDAGAIDLLYNFHFTCDSRECAAKTALENGIQGEMGGGTYTYMTIPEQIAAGTIDESFLDQTVSAMLRTKFSLGLFEDPYPYADYVSSLRTPASRTVLHSIESEAIVLLENRKNTLPLKSSVRSIALIGPQADRVTLRQFGDYVFFNASHNGITPLDGVNQFLSSPAAASFANVKVNFAEGCKLWSNDQSGFAAAVQAAQSSDVAGGDDQTLLWTPGTNATTGEHVDLSDLALVGAQLALVKAVKATGKPTVVVFVSGKPVAEPWIQAKQCLIERQFLKTRMRLFSSSTPGELGGLALAEVLFGAVNPSGKLPVSFPHSVGTTPIFYNYLKGSRPLDPGQVFDNGTLLFAHQYVLNTPVPLWSFGHGLSYTTFNYVLKHPVSTDLKISPAKISASQNFNVVVTVHNTGSVAGQEVVQVYATDVVSSVVTPNQQLVGFKKVNIPWVVEPGVFNIKVGTSDQTFAKANLDPNWHISVKFTPVAGVGVYLLSSDSLQHTSSFKFYPPPYRPNAILHFRISLHRHPSSQIYPEIASALDAIDRSAWMASSWLSSRGMERSMSVPLARLRRTRRTAEARGAVDRNSIFRIASGSKIFTTLETLVLRERGALQWLWRTISPGSLTPPGGWTGVEEDSAPITLRQLATHMSGLTREFPRGDMPNWPYSLEGTGPPPTNGRPFPSNEQTISGLKEYPLNLQTYSYPVYSNVGIGLLGQVAVAANRGFEQKQNITGSPSNWPELAKRDLFGPLGLNGSGFVVTPENSAHVAVASHDSDEVDWNFLDVMSCSGGQMSSLSDYTKLMQTILDPTLPQSLPPATHHPRMAAPRTRMVRRHHRAGTLGASRSVFAINPGMSYGVALLMTGTNPIVGSLVLGHFPIPASPCSIGCWQDAWRVYTPGLWVHEASDSEMVIAVEQGSLWVHKLQLRGSDVLRVIHGIPQDDSDTRTQRRVEPITMWSTGRVHEFRMVFASPSQTCMRSWATIDDGFARGYPTDLVYFAPVQTGDSDLFELHVPAVDIILRQK